MSTDSFNKLVFAAPEAGMSFMVEGDKAGTYHTMILGTTGRGRSVILEQEAARRGIGVDELMRELEPTEEQKEASRKVEEEQKQREATRLQAVRDAYWAASDIDGLEFATIHDSLIEFCSVDDPTHEQHKAVFDLLPSEIIGNGIRWGFNDTEVRDDIYVFVRDNAESVKNAVRAV